MSTGGYTVKATPAKSPRVPDPTCAPASEHVFVARGGISDVMLIARCLGPGMGGLSVVAGTDTVPQFSGITLTPARPVAPCEKLAITVDFFDPDSQVVAVSFGGEDGPGKFTLETVSTTATGTGAFTSTWVFTGERAGSYLIRPTICDARGCATQELLVFVEGLNACTVSCDDGVFCTYDTWLPEGTCTHGPPLFGTPAYEVCPH